MKSKLPLAATLVLVLLTSGCATRNTGSGGKETTLLGGAITYSKDSFQPTTPATVDADTTKIIGKNGPSGSKTTLLWGLITLRDY